VEVGFVAALSRSRCRVVALAGAAATGAAVLAATGAAAATTQPTAKAFVLNTFSWSATVPAGGHATTTVLPYLTDVIHTPIKLSVTGLPNATTASLTPAETTGAMSTLCVETTRQTKPGTYLLTIAGTLGAETETTGFTLTVTG
jgi:hypothetical protein